MFESGQELILFHNFGIVVLFDIGQKLNDFFLLFIWFGGVVFFFFYGKVKPPAEPPEVQKTYFGYNC